jgi:nicotinate-nucleotide adenylyltransferase
MFDPIHFGHLRPAVEILEKLNLREIRFIPAGQPPNRGYPVADAATRLAMVQAALAGEERFVIDECELQSDRPSYSVETLERLRAEHPDRPLCLIVGMDAFLGLPGWHRWRDILDLSHIVIAHRPGWLLQSEGELGALLNARGTRDCEALAAAPAGRLYLQAVTQLEISSSQIRAMAGRGESIRYLLPKAVERVIDAHGCYRSNKEV